MKEGSPYTDIFVAGLRDPHAYQTAKKQVKDVFSVTADATTHKILIDKLAETVKAGEVAAKMDNRCMTNPDQIATNPHSVNDYVNHYAHANLVYFRESEAAMVKEHFHNKV